MIDISNSDKVTKNVNITYNSDEIVNFYLKLKNKKTELSPEMINELKLLKADLANIITRYKFYNS